MSEIDFPPFTPAIQEQQLGGNRRLPLAHSHRLLWSYENRHNRDALLERVVKEAHELRTPEGLIYPFTILAHSSSLVAAMSVLDEFAAAMEGRAIGWDDADRQHVLVDPAITCMTPAEFGDHFRAFVARIVG